MLLPFRSQFGVLRFQIEDLADAGQVQPGLEQVPDSAQPVQIVSAVAARPALAALGLQQPTRLIRAQVLHPHADQLGRRRDAIHATLALRPGHIHRSTSILAGSSLDVASCTSVPRVLQKIYSAHHRS